MRLTIALAFCVFSVVALACYLEYMQTDVDTAP